MFLVFSFPLYTIHLFYCSVEPSLLIVAELYARQLTSARKGGKKEKEIRIDHFFFLRLFLLSLVTASRESKAKQNNP